MNIRHLREAIRNILVEAYAGAPDQELINALQSAGYKPKRGSIAALLQKPGALAGLYKQKADDWGFPPDEALEAVGSELEMCQVELVDDVLVQRGTVGVDFWWDEVAEEWISTEDSPIPSKTNP